MLDQVLLIYCWLTHNDIWKHILYPKPLCKSRSLFNKTKSHVYKIAKHLAQEVSQYSITLFSKKTLKNCVFLHWTNQEFK